jgi:hypothetical protein
MVPFAFRGLGSRVIQQPCCVVSGNLQKTGERFIPPASPQEVAILGLAEAFTGTFTLPQTDSALLESQEATVRSVFAELILNAQFFQRGV